MLVAAAKKTLKHEIEADGKETNLVSCMLSDLFQAQSMPYGQEVKSAALRYSVRRHPLELEPAPHTPR